MHAEHGDVLGFALVFLVARSFSSGCAALTGVEAISNGVPAFRKPKSRNAATTLLMLGTIAVTLFMGMIVLAEKIGVQIVDDPATQLIGAPADYHQKTLVAQLAEAVFGSFHLGFFLITVVTALILVLAANTAFNGFPVLGSILAQDRYLPRQLHTRGDRLAFSNGILFLSLAAIAFVVAFRAEVTALIQLYIVGRVRVVHAQPDRHGPALDAASAHRDRPAVRRRMMRSRVVNTIGFLCTGTVLVVVLVTKFLAGAWIAIVAMTALFVIMKLIHRHYAGVARELAAAGGRRRRHGAAQPQPRRRAGVQAAPADPAGAGLRAGHPARQAGGDHRQRRRRRDPRTGAPSGRTATSPCRSRSSPRRTARSPGRSWITSSGSARTHRARW